MSFCQFPIKSKGLDRYLRECMREWEFMSLWALLILIYDLNPNLRILIWSQKIFCLWALLTWLILIYKGHSGTAAGALLILILWFDGNLREWFEAKKFSASGPCSYLYYDLVATCENDLKLKNFLPMDMALYTIYIRPPRHCGRGLNSTHMLSNLNIKIYLVNKH